MTKTYMKSFTLPKTWEGISTRKEKYVMKANPGYYGKQFVIPLGVVFKLLGLVKATRESKNIIKNKKVLINHRKAEDIKHPVGFTDILDIEGTKYRVNLNSKGKLIFEPLTKDHNLKPAKIIGKTVLNNGKTQLNLNDSRNVLIKDGKYKVGDTVVLELPKQEIKEVVELKEGANIILTKGKHFGDRGIVKEIKGNELIYINKEQKEIKTPKSYVFVLPKILQ